MLDAEFVNYIAVCQLLVRQLACEYVPFCPTFLYNACVEG
jgi:hypothetical protein